MNSMSSITSRLMNETIDQLRGWFTSAEGQGEVLVFHKMLHDTLGSEDGYVAVCEEATATNFRVTPEILALLDERFGRFDRAARSGHDINHFRRDELVAFALAFGDEGFKNARYPIELQPALLAGGRHDTVSVAVYPRYLNMPATHEVVGSYVFYHLTEGLLPEPIRLLGSYFVNAHQHQTKPIAYTEPFVYERIPVPDAMFERDGKLVRVGVVFVRACDRGDTNALTQALRHFAANGDVVESGIVGIDVVAGGTSGHFVMDVEALKVAFLPVVRGSWLKPPTVAEHVVDYAKSQDGTSVYSKNDHLFPLLKEIITAKRKEAADVSSYLTAKLQRSGYTDARLQVKFAGLMRVVVGGAGFDEIWPIIWHALEQESLETKQAWYSSLFKFEEMYADWVSYIGNLALSNTPEEFHTYLKDRINSALS